MTTVNRVVKDHKIGTGHVPSRRVKACRGGFNLVRASMSENGGVTGRKTTIHKLVDYFGAITVPGTT